MNKFLLFVLVIIAPAIASAQQLSGSFKGVLYAVTLSSNPPGAPISNSLDVNFTAKDNGRTVSIANRITGVRVKLRKLNNNYAQGVFGSSVFIGEVLCNRTLGISMRRNNNAIRVVEIESLACPDNVSVYVKYRAIFRKR